MSKARKKTTGRVGATLSRESLKELQALDSQYGIKVRHCIELGSTILVQVLNLVFDESGKKHMSAVTLVTLDNVLVPERTLSALTGVPLHTIQWHRIHNNHYGDSVITDESGVRYKLRTAYLKTLQLKGE